ncbi:MAG: hypothetical protein COY38_03635 [Candidatus Aenigmarchaeota archaeon CG_4_10_14_0_8_um_filter_37_24]|nr:hypothetical protein [Candidatus Aenigmarchaeota archaeon]OIN85148.1 MAG: hypothetical protein AUJ50_05525 [Candidatus Aenigmarchaeota archaeon CG1_02_38_14]PIV69097.1 MAG: hypothetical protein COS07_01915 [Candidatus Aenigmarchaeota archaeon CG01_land_8_20_14_3_00_37_9]PIW40903.1 MAG: hypothetical protein COW21_04720 [Candidatus Aenigmarchaeota archaeon CG15_BIG_FIL_POST_REV_8_21_14_020_37_27]PIY35552.1 MAG: hypothetical protein COZ04_03105 [Candidatus Aenigmarchaeota archaeon CG_4_10_14_3_
MPSFSNKAQFFILTSVMIVFVFFSLSKYVNQYSLIDTSKVAEGAETFMFENIKEKAIKTIHISNFNNVDGRLQTYKDFVQDMANDRGYKLTFDYQVVPPKVFFNMILMSEKYTISSQFPVIIPGDCDSLCTYSGYDRGTCEENSLGQCEVKGGTYSQDGDTYCTDGPSADTCCCWPNP